VRAIARISKYNEKGRMRAKLYIPSRVFSMLGGGEVVLSFGGEVFKVSASRVSSGVRAGKLYLPKCICEKLLEDGAEGAVIEVGKGRVEILNTVKFCRICGEPTTAPDGICLGQHFDQIGLCIRCGRKLPEDGLEKKVLCDDCVKTYASLCGLGEWFEPSPGSAFTFESGRMKRSKKQFDNYQEEF